MRVRAYVAIMAGAAVLSMLLSFVLLRDAEVDGVLAQLRADAVSPLVWAHAATIAVLYAAVRSSGAPVSVLHATDTALLGLLISWMGHLDAWFGAYFVIWFAVMAGVNN